MCQFKVWDADHVPLSGAEGGGAEEAEIEADDDEDDELLLLGGLLPRPQIEKSKSSALWSRLCFSKYWRNSFRERNFLPSGLKIVTSMTSLIMDDSTLEEIRAQKRPPNQEIGTHSGSLPCIFSELEKINWVPKMKQKCFKNTI